MSLTAPIKPTPPTVPAVKMQPVESSSQGTGQTETTTQKAQVEKPAEKPTVQEKTVIKQQASGEINQPVTQNTTIINKVEQNDQNKIPLLNGSQGQENVKNSAVTEVPPASQNKLAVSGLDVYAGSIVLILLCGAAVWFFTKRKSFKKPMLTIRQRKETNKTREKPRETPRTVFDYAAENTKEIVDLITTSADIPQEGFQPPKRKPGKALKEVKSNFEFRV